MNIFKIKWELILAIILGFMAIVGFNILTDDLYGFVMEVILVFAFTAWIVGYKDIKAARQLLIKYWK